MEQSVKGNFDRMIEDSRRNRNTLNLNHHVHNSSRSSARDAAYDWIKQYPLEGPPDADFTAQAQDILNWVIPPESNRI